MIALFTDFGVAGPYVGQLHAVLVEHAPGLAVVDLFHDVPRFDIRAGAYLLPAYTSRLPAGTVIVAVVDPGVGGARRPLMLRADTRWFVGPDNGLFELVARRATDLECLEIEWRPQRLSASFHGRDLFAPVAAELGLGRVSAGRQVERAAASREWPDDLAEIVYIDTYGNAITGLRASSLPAGAVLRVQGASLPCARTFSDLPAGQAFWYENANGLVELAVNQGHAANLLGWRCRQPVAVSNA